MHTPNVNIHQLNVSPPIDSSQPPLFVQCVGVDSASMHILQNLLTKMTENEGKLGQLKKEMETLIRMQTEWGEKIAGLGKMVDQLAADGQRFGELLQAIRLSDDSKRILDAQKERIAMLVERISVCAGEKADWEAEDSGIYTLLFPRSAHSALLASTHSFNLFSCLAGARPAHSNVSESLHSFHLKSLFRCCIALMLKVLASQDWGGWGWGRLCSRGQMLEKGAKRGHTRFAFGFPFSSIFLSHLYHTTTLFSLVLLHLQDCHCRGNLSVAAAL